MVRIPYGRGFIEFDEKGSPVLESSIGELKSERPGREIVKAALENPIDSVRLRELAEGRKNCVIIISDHTRPVPSKDILPEMIAELEAGSSDIEITLLVATGFHRLTTEEELKEKLGEDIIKRCKIAVHDCRNTASNVQIGILPSGAPLVIDRIAAETELLVSEGFIEPHFFAGFSGGRKSVLPGVCDAVTVLGNHCSRFIDSKYSRTGILDKNPIHEDMLAAAEMAGLKFIVNVIIDEDKKTVAAFAGNYRTAHRAGCDYLMDYCRVSPRYADIVISSNGGAPLDQNLYQAVKGMTAAEATCNEGGTIILCAECADGHGGEGFYKALKDCDNPRELYERQMSTPQSETVPDQWESQILARILIHHRLIVVTRPEMKEIVDNMKMTWAGSLEEALEIADYGEGKSLTVIPNGISVIVKE